MIAASFTARLTLRGPVLTQSTTQGRFGVDAALARSGGHFYLPGTLVKGLLAEAWQELSCADPSFEQARKDWLGEGSGRWADEVRRVRDYPKRARLFFDDFIDDSTPIDDTTTRFRIEIDDARGSVEHGHYLVIEAPYPSGKHVAFEAILWALCPDEEEAEDLRKRVQTGLRWIAAIGAERSVGFGRVVGGVCGPLTCLTWPAPPAPADPAISPPAAFDLALHFTQPFCVAGRRTADNVFDSEPWITGSVLKGALATLLDLVPGLWPNLQQHLHAVRFTHAYPAPDTPDTPDTMRAVRPIYPPESLVTADGHAFHDVIFLPQARLLDGKPPAFKVDWKGDAKSRVYQLFGWADPSYELRVRTAIDGASRRAAENELFAYRMVVPNGVAWLASVSLAGVDDAARPTVAAELGQALQHGLFALGKTKARASVAIAARTLPTAAPTGDLVAITLQSAVLLCDPSRYLLSEDEPHKPKPGSTDRDTMWFEYADVWEDLSGGALALEHYFHRQSLAGGDYLRRRFQHGKPYRPYLLTDAGSVFLFKVRDADRATTYLTCWLQRGIELSPAVRRFYGLDQIPAHDLWQACPYLPENGFGEIAIDVHLTPPAGVEVWDA